MRFHKVLDKYRQNSFSERDKSNRFEHLMQRYLLTDPKYSNLFYKVWLWNEFPGKSDLGGGDAGIDIVALTFEGDYWAIFYEFYNNQGKLRELAHEIKAIAKDPILVSKVAQVEDDENYELDTVKEGQVLYKLHKVRERDKTIIAEKKKSVLKANGKLECEACGFNFENKYGEIGKGFIECHDIVPLSKFDGSKETKLKDLALVCSNCHRMLHRDISVLNIDEFKLKVIKSN